MARLSDGGMRDAISLLDRCAAFGDTITAQITAEAAGAAGRDYLLRMMEALSAKDTAQVLQIVAELHDASKDLQRLCEELILMQRDLMLLKATGDTSLLHCMADEIPTLQKLAYPCSSGRRSWKPAASSIRLCSAHSTAPMQASAGMSSLWWRRIRSS